VKNVGDTFYFVYHNLNRGLMLVQHYTVFPLALGQILREYAVSELHLTLNAGNWNYDRWGYPEEKGVGTGAELWAWMGQGTTT
jgi:phosphatidylinositol glycan class T